MKFPPAVRHRVEVAYREADVILEYGSGGSTVFAASLGKHVTSVESDARWVEAGYRCIAERHPEASVRIEHVDIGPVGVWGKPLNAERMADFHRYPLAIWDDPAFKHPDVILIDGRFRVACFCAAAMRIERETLVLFDDYAEREAYHIVERLAAPISRIERMAIFQLQPGAVPRRELTWIIGSFTKTTYAQ